MIKKLLAFAALIVAGPGWAGTQTVTLSVPGMTCATRATENAGYPASVATSAVR